MIFSYTANLATILTVVRESVLSYRRTMSISRTIKMSAVMVQGEPSSRIQEDNLTFEKVDGVSKTMSRKSSPSWNPPLSVDFTLHREDLQSDSIGGLLDSKGHGFELARNSSRRINYRTRPP